MLCITVSFACRMPTFDRSRFLKLQVESRPHIYARILLFFVIAGEPILTATDIPLPAFQLAGGLVLLSVLLVITILIGSFPNFPVPDLPNLRHISVIL